MRKINNVVYSASKYPCLQPGETYMAQVDGSFRRAVDHLQGRWKIVSPTRAEGALINIDKGPALENELIFFSQRGPLNPSNSGLRAGPFRCEKGVV